MLAETKVFFFLALPYDHNHDSPQSIPKFDWSFISFITRLNLCFNLHVFDECRSTYYLYLLYLFNNCNWCDSAFQTRWFMVFNATFNNISAISWRVSFIGGGIHRVPGENQRHAPTASHWQTLSQNAVSSTPPLRRVQTRNVSGVNPTTKRSRPRLPIYSKPATGF